MLTALHRWIARRRVRRAPRPHGRFVDTLFAGGDAAIGDQERPLGYGGFDSSHERRAGLMVQEHVPAEAVANALPLGTVCSFTWPSGGGRRRTGIIEPPGDRRPPPDARR